MIENKDSNNLGESGLPYTYSSSEEDQEGVCIRVKDLDEGTHHNIDSSSIPLNQFANSIDPSLIWEDYWDERQEIKKKLFRMVAQGKAEQLRKLLESQTINVNEFQFLDAWTCLHHAANQSNLQIIKILVDNGCGINNQTLSMKYTPLHLAVLQKNTEVCTLLLKLGADPNIPDVDFFTPMHYIVDNEYQELLDLFITQPNINFLAQNNRKMNAIDCCRCRNMKNKIRDYLKIKPNQNTNRFYLTRVISIDKDRHYILRTRADFVEKILEQNNHKNNRIQQAENQAEDEQRKENLPQKCKLLGNNIKKGRFRKASWMAEKSINIFKASMIEVDQTAIQSLENYDILKLLGNGSFGEVFLGRRKQSSRMVAIKRLKKKEILEKKMKKYVMAQRAILKDVSHPFIVHGHSFFQDAKFIYMVMEFCAGGDLERLVRKGKLSEDLAKKYCCEVILALQELHSKNYLFRDLKSSNVLIDESGHVKLSDFGLAKQSELSDSFLGSFAYLAPQMLVETDNKPHSFTIDWYLMGVFAYQLLIGIPPFFNKNKTVMLEQIKNAKPKYMPHLSPTCKDFLDKTLQKQPHKRLGANGAEEIKKHKWFEDINWKEVCNKQLDLPKPEVDWSELRKREFLDDVLLFSTETKEEGQIRGWNYWEQ